MIRVDTRNTGSLKVIEKSGFSYSHDEKIEHRSEFRLESVEVSWHELGKR